MTRPYKRGLACSKCDAPRAPGHRYCREHRAEYMREWRLKEAQLFRKLRRIVRNVSRETVAHGADEGALKR